MIPGSQYTEISVYRDLVYSPTVYVYISFYVGSSGTLLKGDIIPGPSREGGGDYHSGSHTPTQQSGVVGSGLWSGQDLGRVVKASRFLASPGILEVSTLRRTATHIFKVYIFLDIFKLF